MTSLLGIHTILPGQDVDWAAEMYRAGRPFPIIKLAGVISDSIPKYRAASPGSVVVIRTSGSPDNLPTEHLEEFHPEENSELGRASLRRLKDRGLAMMSMTQEALGGNMWLADRVEIANEPDPGGTESDPGLGYRNLGYLLHGAADWRDQNRPNLRLIMPAFNAGTPSWAKIKAFVETGIVKRMKASGDWLAFHEGVFGDEMPIETGFPYDFSREGGPTYPEVGALCFRYRQMLNYLKSRDEMVPFVISEFYPGGGHGHGSDPEKTAEIVRRFAWYDRGCQKDRPWIKGILPFTLGTQQGWWAESTYDDMYANPGGFMEYAKSLPKESTITGLRVKVNANVRMAPVNNKANPTILMAVYAGTIFPPAQETRGDWVRVSDRGWIVKSLLEEIR